MESPGLDAMGGGWRTAAGSADSFDPAPPEPRRFWVLLELEMTDPDLYEADYFVATVERDLPSLLEGSTIWRAARVHSITAAGGKVVPPKRPSPTRGQT